MHYKIFNPLNRDATEGWDKCEQESAKYGYLSITFPVPRNKYENAQIFEIIQRHELGGVWLGLNKTDYGLTMDGHGDRQSMGSLDSTWSSISTSNHVMCVFMDYTSLEDSVCTTVSL